MKKLWWLGFIILAGCASPDYREMAQDTGAGAGLTTWDAMSESAVLADGDLVGITNVSVTTGSIDGTSEKITWAQLQTNIETGVLTGGSANWLTTGTLQGAVSVVTTTDGTESPTAAQMYGSWFIADHATATSDTTYTLPTAVAGMSACFYDNGAGTGGISVDPAADDLIILDGTAMAVLEDLESPGVGGDGANGDFACILAIDATNWITLGMSGTWVEETP